MKLELKSEHACAVLICGIIMVGLIEIVNLFTLKLDGTLMVGTSGVIGGLVGGALGFKLKS